MNKQVSSLVLLWTLLSVVTLNVTLAHAEPIRTEIGFKKIEDPALPAQVRATSDSVFEIRIVSEENLEDIVVLNLTEPKNKDIDQRMRENPNLDELERIVFIKQFERCRREQIETACPLYTGIEKATGFLVKDGSQIMTNAHVVNRILKLQARQQGKPVPELLKTSPWVSVFLFNKEGKLVFDPYLNRPSLVKFETPSKLGLTSPSGWYAEDTDYVVVQLPKVLGKPLKIAAAAKTGEMLYRLGYASCTGCELNPNQANPELNRDRGAGLNSNGVGLYWSRGKSQALDVVQSLLRIPSEFFSLSKKENFLFFAADAQIGMSGGPILNEAGEVVGVFAGSKPVVASDGSMIVISRGVRPLDFGKN